MKDDGLTFGTNANAGVCLHVREKGAVATPDGSASPTLLLDPSPRAG